MSDRSSGDFRANEQRAFTGTKTFNRLVDAMMRGDGPAMGAGLNIPWSVPVVCALESKSRDSTNFRWRYTARVVNVAEEFVSGYDETNFPDDIIAWNAAEWSTDPLIPKIPVRVVTDEVHALYPGWLVTIDDFVFFMFNVPVPEMVAVNLTMDGGDDGQHDFAATYTYTVTHTISETQLGVQIAPEMQRANGLIVPATKGMALLYQSPVRLWWCDEVPETAGCT